MSGQVSMAGCNYPTHTRMQSGMQDRYVPNQPIGLAYGVVRMRNVLLGRKEVAGNETVTLENDIGKHEEGPATRHISRRGPQRAKDKN